MRAGTIIHTSSQVTSSNRVLRTELDGIPSYIQLDGDHTDGLRNCMDVGVAGTDVVGLDDCGGVGVVWSVAWAGDGDNTAAGGCSHVDSQLGTGCQGCQGLVVGQGLGGEGAGVGDVGADNIVEPGPVRRGGTGDKVVESGGWEGTGQGSVGGGEDGQRGSCGGLGGADVCSSSNHATEFGEVLLAPQGVYNGLLHGCGLACMILSSDVRGILGRCDCCQGNQGQSHQVDCAGHCCPVTATAAERYGEEQQAQRQSVRR